jgi:hypothetical protein
MRSKPLSPKRLLQNSTFGRPRSAETKDVERILAELIVEHCDALGLASKRREHNDDAAERIRKVLAKEVDAFLDRSRSSKIG